jgi:hypothetical protein
MAMMTMMMDRLNSWIPRTTRTTRRQSVYDAWKQDFVAALRDFADLFADLGPRGPRAPFEEAPNPS